MPPAVVYHAQLGAEAGHLDFASVARTIFGTRWSRATPMSSAKRAARSRPSSGPLTGGAKSGPNAAGRAGTGTLDGVSPRPAGAHPRAQASETPRKGRIRLGEYRTCARQGRRGDRRAGRGARTIPDATEAEFGDLILRARQPRPALGRGPRGGPPGAPTPGRAAVRLDTRRGSPRRASDPRRSDLAEIGRALGRGEGGGAGPEASPRRRGGPPFRGDPPIASDHAGQSAPALLHHRSHGHPPQDHHRHRPRTGRCGGGFSSPWRVPPTRSRSWASRRSPANVPLAPPRERNAADRVRACRAARHGGLRRAATRRLKRGASSPPSTSTARPGARRAGAPARADDAAARGARRSDFIVETLSRRTRRQRHPLPAGTAHQHRRSPDARARLSRRRIAGIVLMGRGLFRGRQHHAGRRVQPSMSTRKPAEIVVPVRRFADRECRSTSPTRR